MISQHYSSWIKMYYVYTLPATITARPITGRFF